MEKRIQSIFSPEGTGIVHWPGDLSANCVTRPYGSPRPFLDLARSEICNTILLHTFTIFPYPEPAFSVIHKTFHSCGRSRLYFILHIALSFVVLMGLEFITRNLSSFFPFFLLKVPKINSESDSKFEPSLIITLLALMAAKIPPICPISDPCTAPSWLDGKKG